MSAIRTHTCRVEPIGQSFADHRPRDGVFGRPTVEAQAGLGSGSCAP